MSAGPLARGVRIHPTADVSARAQIGAGTSIWNQSQVRENAVIGERCIIGKDVYVDRDVRIGDDVKIQNAAQVYHGVTIESGVFIGPAAVFTNDLLPRAITPAGELKRDADWEVRPTLVEYGASVGAGAVVLPGVRIGRFALVGAGAIVTRDVPAHTLVVGNPARAVGRVCACARRVEPRAGRWYCASCDAYLDLE